MTFLTDDGYTLHYDTAYDVWTDGDLEFAASAQDGWPEGTTGRLKGAVLYDGRYLMTTTAKIIEFTEQVARLHTERETRGGFTQEDACQTINGLIKDARKTTGIEPGYDDVYCVTCGEDMANCDCEKPGPCLTCGTRCDDEGICPVCVGLEHAEELVREATAEAVKAGLRGKVPAATQAALRKAYAARTKALEAEVTSCRKCGAPLNLGDLVSGEACVDFGEGAEAGNVFIYCSHRCMENH
jgi:hypothetical protein